MGALKVSVCFLRALLLLAGVVHISGVATVLDATFQLVSIVRCGSVSVRKPHFARPSFPQRLSEGQHQSCQPMSSKSPSTPSTAKVPRQLLQHFVWLLHDPAPRLL